MLGNTHAAVGAASGLIVLGGTVAHSPVALVAGATLGECLAIDKITGKRRSKTTLTNEERR